MQQYEFTEPERLACDISDVAGGIEDILLAPIAEWPAGDWPERFRESRKRLATMSALLDQIERDWAESTGNLRAAEFASALRVTTMLDAEADGAPSPMLAALWRRLASNIRRELSD